MRSRKRSTRDRPSPSLSRRKEQKKERKEREGERRQKARHVPRSLPSRRRNDRRLRSRRGRLEQGLGAIRVFPHAGSLGGSTNPPRNPDLPVLQSPAGRANLTAKSRTHRLRLGNAHQSLTRTGFDVPTPNWRGILSRRLFRGVFLEGDFVR